MKCIIFANGEYGDNLDIYEEVLKNAELIICADGGANYAYRMGVKPAVIIGDMDSICPLVKEYYLQTNIPTKKYPRHKDFTDTQLALNMAEDLGASEIILLGSLGKRLDHTLSNLYSCIEMARNGLKISHHAPGMTVYMVTDRLEITGNIGDLVSVLVLSDVACGVYEKGFAYPLDNAVLFKENPFTVSNRLATEWGEITIDDGVLAVFHFKDHED